MGLSAITAVLILAAAVPLTVRFVGGAGTDRYDYYADVLILEETFLEHRLVDLEGTRNTRDIGGYPAAGGSQSAWGMLYRSDNLSYLTDKDLEVLVSIGITSIVDLREEKRIGKYPNRIPDSVEYLIYPVYDKTKPLHIPLLAGRKRIPEIFRESYIEYLEDWGHRMKPVFELLADPDAYPILIHCTNGKDRVGVITALVLDLLGVPREYIISDYSLSNLNLEDMTANFIDNEEGALLLRLGVPYADLADLMGVRSEWIEHMLNHVHASYGSAEAYLTEHVGISSNSISEIRSLLLNKEFPGIAGE